MRYIIENVFMGTDALAKSMEKFVKENPGFRVINVTPSIGHYGAEQYRWVVLYGKEES